MSDERPGPTGAGLLTGLRTTLRAMTRRAVTSQYPDVQPMLPPRSRGVIALLEENCTVCMLCARECPDWCIYIDSHKEVVPARDPGARDRTKNVLDRFAIDFSLCMYCGICIEVCPFDALFWSPEFGYSELDIRELTHERDRLGQWMATVPAPDPLAANAAESKESAVARQPAGSVSGGTGAARRRVNTGTQPSALAADVDASPEPGPNEYGDAAPGGGPAADDGGGG